MANTVFNKINPEGMHSNEILAIVLHRTAAILYYMYTAWGLVSIGINMPEFLTEHGHEFGDFFLFLVPPIALCAGLGATQFPKWGRMEMFAASALVSLIIIFDIIGGINAWNNPEHPRLWANLLLNTTPIVLPVMRAGFIFRTLVWQSKKQKRA